MPLVNKIGNWILKAMNGFENLNKKSIMFRDILSVLGDSFSWFFKIATTGIRLIVQQFELVGNTISWVADKLGLAGGSGESFYLRMRPYLQWIYQMFGKIADVATKVMTGDFKGAWQGFKNFKMPDMKEIRNQQAKEVAEMAGKAQIKDDNKSLNPAALKPDGRDLSGIDGGKKKKGNAKDGGVSGGGNKQITINIQNLMPGVTVNATTIKEGIQDIGRIMQEELLKMLADVSLAEANE